MPVNIERYGRVAEKYLQRYDGVDLLTLPYREIRRIVALYHGQPDDCDGDKFGLEDLGQLACLVMDDIKHPIEPRLIDEYPEGIVFNINGDNKS